MHVCHMNLDAKQCAYYGVLYNRQSAMQSTVWAAAIPTTVLYEQPLTVDGVASRSRRAILCSYAVLSCHCCSTTVSHCHKVCLPCVLLQGKLLTVPRPSAPAMTAR